MVVVVEGQSREMLEGGPDALALQSKCHNKKDKTIRDTARWPPGWPATSLHRVVREEVKMEAALYPRT